MREQIEFNDDQEAMDVAGVQDRNLKLVRDHYGVKVSARGRMLHIEGDEAAVRSASDVLGRMRKSITATGVDPDQVLDRAIQDLRSAARTEVRWGSLALDKIARTEGQLRYLEAMAQAAIVLATGPAGTGKTYLAVLMAVEALNAGAVKKIVLCRPAVEAGEKLGFLPGDFQAKVNPYLRPLYDALNDLLDYDQVRRYSDREIIEIVPLAYMRGRTLNRSFIILDEAQNTTRSQMKMFLTRMGYESRIVVTGDVTQVDLPAGQPSGLLHARRILTGIPGIEWSELGAADIVRNPLVTKIVKAYERNEGGTEGPDPKVRRGPRGQDSDTIG
ncbi:MAG: PhoH family protein [Planctomycetota bacterium]